jgi:hypothetical protein
MGGRRVAVQAADRRGGSKRAPLGEKNVAALVVAKMRCVTFRGYFAVETRDFLLKFGGERASNAWRIDCSRPVSTEVTVEPKEHKLWAQRIDDALARLKRLPPGMIADDSRDAASTSSGRLERSVRRPASSGSSKR